jgi:CBS domain-containing protein
VSEMRISDVLRSKGSTVATVPPGATVGRLVEELAKHNVGALVVVDAEAVVGIVSERDIVRRLNERGPGLLDARVSEIMTTSVVTCAPTDSVDSLAATMTERRIRHMPVLVDGKLAGIVSIGDVVKSRIGELESDREQLASYIAGT